MYLQHFGLKHDPLGKTIRQTIEQPQYAPLEQKLNWLLQTKGVGLITGEAGTGKTTSVREWTKKLNPMTHKVIYQSDNHFRPFDIYCQLSESLGLEKHHRYSKLWRILKQELLELYDHKQLTPIWILDEAHHLPASFLIQLPSFLNFSFDTRDIMVILFVGLPLFDSALKRSIYSALNSRILFHYSWQPLDDFNAFSAFVVSAFKKAGKQETILSQSGLKLMHVASKGRLRETHKMITQSLQLAAARQINHLPDEIIELSINQLRSD